MIKRSHSVVLSGLAALVMGFSTLISSQSLANSSVPQSEGQQRATIYQSTLDKNLKELGEISSGDVQIDRLRDEVALTLYGPRDCRPEEICSSDVPIALETVLPMVKMTRDECGVITIEARSEKLGAQSAFERLMIRDYSKRVCKYSISAETEVSYHTVHTSVDQRKLVRTDSFFKAFALESSVSR